MNDKFEGYLDKRDSVARPQKEIPLRIDHLAGELDTLASLISTLEQALVPVSKATPLEEYVNKESFDDTASGLATQLVNLTDRLRFETFRLRQLEERLDL